MGLLTAMMIVILAVPATAYAKLKITAMASYQARQAPGVTVIGDDAGRFNDWLSLAAMPTPKITVRIRMQQCPAYANGEAVGCEDESTDPTTLWLTPGQAPLALRTTFFHELGHRLIGIDPPQWFVQRFMAIDRQEEGKPDHGWYSADAFGNDPDERAADAYALCSTWRSLPSSHLIGRSGDGLFIYDGQSPEMSYGWAPTPEQHRAACSLLRSYTMGR